MKNVLQWLSAAVFALAAGSVYAQSLNTCDGQVGAPTEGAHSSGIVAASATPVDGVFWPPNHKLRTVTISAENSSGDPCNVTINDVRQDEPVTGGSSGDTAPDAANCSNAGYTSTVDLRGERDGTGTGRFYTITYTMSDPKAPGMDKMATATLLVPHDQGTAHFGAYVNEGPVYESSAQSGTGATDPPITCAN